ncbi:MAG: hypothetical protein R2746_02215 [Acidimicrobiales bacterium]
MNLPLPESYRAAYVKRDEQDMWRGSRWRTRTPASSTGEVALPELAPDEVYVAQMASAINFNTVWTSIFEPVSTFGFLDRLGKESVAACHALPYHVVGLDGAGVVLRVGLGGAQLEAGRPRHPPLQPPRRPGPVGPRRLHARLEPAHLGLRDQLRRPGRPHRGEGQPADAQARPPHVGGVRATRCATPPPIA